MLDVQPAEMQPAPSADRPPTRSRRAQIARYGRAGLLVLAIVVTVFGVQSALYYHVYTPPVLQANQRLFDLLVESSQHTVYHRVAANMEELGKSTPGGEERTSRMVRAWRDFDNHFVAAPTEAVDVLQKELTVSGNGVGDETGMVEDVGEDLQRLREIYADVYKPLLADIADPPIYLWPSISFLAKRSGYPEVLTFNRTVQLAQVGEIGTARVILTGLNASVDDPKMLAVVYYMLGRLQFELFRSRPELEYYTQSVQYLRQSLRADPDAQLTKRFFDYLLSLDQGAAAPRDGQGRPTSPSEGEGAAISSDERKF